jgi:hypothetical protein
MISPNFCRSPTLSSETGAERNEFSGDAALGARPTQGRLLPVPGKICGAFSAGARLYHINQAGQAFAEHSQSLNLLHRILNKKASSFLEASFLNDCPLTI